jgi:EAL domain-containing protein (putative c-di-GMP-specific phosphodiesterase class I)
MYQAKDDGRNTFQFYSAKYTSEAETFLFMASEMQKALEKEQFYLVYQPQFDMTTGHIIGIEALLRWPHPTRGLIPPDQFIPIAEMSGLIRQLGFWVMGQACQTARNWLDQGLSFGRMAVNVSGPQFHYKEFNQEVTDILAKTHLPARCLELEVTESFVMKDAAEIPNKLNELKHMGISLSIDDFGTGYSSMSSLSQLPIDKLKIDKSFVADIPGNHNAEAMAEAIIAMARALQLNVVVEGVETQEHIRFFAKYGCEGQGYFYSKPIEAEACTRLLRGSVESD